MILTPIQQLEQLLDTSIHSESGLFHIEELKQPLTESTQKEIIRGFQRLKTFQRFPVDSWSLTAFPQGKLAHYAEYVAQAKSQNIKRLSSVKRTAHLVAFITVYRTIALDEVLLALNKFYTGVFNLSVAKEKKERLRSIKDLDRSAVTLANVGDILLDSSIQDQELRNHIYSFVTKEAIENAVLTVNDLTRNKAHPIAIDTLLENYSKFKKFIKRILDFIPFEGNRYGEKTMAIWSVIREKYPKKITKQDYQKQKESIPRKWQNFIEQHPESTHQAFIILGIEQWIKSFKNHEIYVPYSKKYNDPLQKLLSAEEMAPFLSPLLEQTTFSANGEEVLKQLKQDLNLSYKVAVKAWKTSDMAHIERKNGTNRLALKRLDKQERNSSAEKLKVAVKMRMPRIDLPDILMDICQRLQIDACFTHMTENNSRMSQLDISLMAVILSEACNVGLTPVAKETVEALKIDRLRYVDQYYLRLSTITEANNKLVTAYQEQELSSHWGSGDMASADAIRFKTGKKSLYGGRNPKYYGDGQGISLYNFVLDSYIGFHGMIVSGTIRDSIYLLEGLLNQTSTVDPKQIMTDTAGYSDLVFGLFASLGYQFSPRIANGGETKLWRFHSEEKYGVLQQFSQNFINEKLIVEHWEDILKVSASLFTGAVQASDIIRALQRGGNPTPLGRAFIELGKVYKTKHQLRYMTDENYVRQILEQLNKIESRHTLCRKVFYNKNGKVYQTYINGMEEQLHSLGFTVNCIIYWNTLYIQEAIKQLKKEGMIITDEDIQRLSPLLTEHINFMGKYTFQHNEAVKNGELRPLYIDER